MSQHFDNEEADHADDEATINLNGAMVAPIVCFLFLVVAFAFLASAAPGFGESFEGTDRFFIAAMASLTGSGLLFGLLHILNIYLARPAPMVLLVALFVIVFGSVAWYIRMVVGPVLNL